VPSCERCYNANAAESGVCREARDGACVGYVEEHSVDGGRHRAQRSSAQGSTEGDERVREATCTQGSNNCQTCGATIGTDTYCSVCNSDGTAYAPVNGVCVDVSASNQFCTGHASGVCNQCGDASFMFKGGCYQTGDQNPGNTLCTAASDGKCTTAAAGYFIPPGATASKQSVVKCDDTTGVTVGSNTYKGVDKCATCTAPSSGQTATCTTCIDGYFAESSGATCTICIDPCKTCKGANNKCTSCKDTGDHQYFKEGDANDGTGTCVAEDGCGNTHFPVAADKKCYSCSNTDKGGIASCQTCTMSGSAVTCTTCTGTKKPTATGTACVVCTIVDCANCNEENVCEACSSSKYLTSTGQCVDSCDKLGGYYVDSNVCKPCDPSCASCVGANANQCSACPAGKVLQYTTEGAPANGGSCVDECKTNTGGCADCGATIGGSKYCSKCSDTNQAPLNGNCAANTMRTQLCTTVKDGACTQCASGYFLLDGGCYQTTRQPGSQVCTTDNNGKCTKCANEQTPDPSTGVCPACPAGCSTCSGSGDPKTCSECLAGYYLSGTSCVKCSENSTNGGNTITGVKDCVSCAAPTSNSGTVTCYVTQDPTVDPTDPSVNKGGLSSGAIAGISVAVIAVVGGLVGFLCWWFVCRGKA
ncbi:Variant-specific surface protein, partial [Giardia duodenalis]